MGYKYFRKKTAPNELSWREVKTYLPKSLYDSLKAKSEITKLPMSRLIAYAVDKELEEGNDAFKYDCEEPKTIFVEGAYTDEGGRIYRYLLRNGSPLSVDQFLLARRDIGVPEKMTLLLGLRELVERATLVEFVRPTWSKFLFKDDYLVLAVKTSADDKKKKEIEKLKEKLAKLEGPNGGSIGTETSDRPETEE